jgi:arsenite methyltransferase
MKVMSMPSETERLEIQEYYGRILQNSSDLKTNACCTSDAIPEIHRKILSEMPTEILEKFYGCGSPIPVDANGRVILDLGCGTGRDAYLIARLAGPMGKVIGIDMTAEQLEVANRYVDRQTQTWGLSNKNLEFRLGYLEDLAGSGIQDESIDIVISNCVLNLSMDKEAAFREIFRVLKPGGELYFSDVFADRRVPTHLQNDPVLRGECLSGAMYWEDFRRLMRKVGCLDYRMVSKRRMTLGNTEVEAKIGMVPFHSATIRAFKLKALEDQCEDYGQTATYLGTIADNPHAFILDDHHTFPIGKPVLVCGNTASMVEESRFGKHFKVTGNRAIHFGIFPCGPTANLGSEVGDVGLAGACC